MFLKYCFTSFCFLVTTWFHFWAVYIIFVSAYSRDFLLLYILYSSHSRVAFNWRCFKPCIILFLQLSVVLPSWSSVLCFLPGGSPRSYPSLALPRSSLTIWLGQGVQPCDLLLWLWVPRWHLKQNLKSVTVCGDRVLTSWLPAKSHERYAKVNCKGGQGCCHVKSPVLHR